ncbi:MAG: SDR family NAD(P)-dependent oxidoreductase [Lachnospiraceae bacterium]|jgi:3-oxoacyl-[acyl-carrier protein] reductase|nr:SDR family NAD(P)-dependent oxidoreductase [Lachnospiraceae bacterium]
MIRREMSDHGDEKRTALITGASRGIGLAIAKRFASVGYDLILVCHQSKDSLTIQAKEWADSYGIMCRVHQTNIGDFQDVKKIFDSIPTLDVLINNAGISHIGLLQDMEPQEWRAVMAVNLDAVFFTCKLAIPLMLAKQQGSILNISSVWGNVGASMETAYSASKGAVNAFTKALGKELAPSHIAVNAIAYGMVDTDMNRMIPPSDLESLRNDIPIGRMATPEEAAALAFSLIHSPVYLTGQVITMDGGWT